MELIATYLAVLSLLSGQNIFLLHMKGVMSIQIANNIVTVRLSLVDNSYKSQLLATNLFLSANSNMGLLPINVHHNNYYDVMLITSLVDTS